MLNLYVIVCCLFVSASCPVVFVNITRFISKLSYDLHAIKRCVWITVALPLTAGRTVQYSTQLTQLLLMKTSTSSHFLKSIFIIMLFKAFFKIWSFQHVLLILMMKYLSICIFIFAIAVSLFSLMIWIFANTVLCDYLWILDELIINSTDAFIGLFVFHL